jgi:hypothetical protein
MKDTAQFKPSFDTNVEYVNLEFTPAKDRNVAFIHSNRLVRGAIMNAENSERIKVKSMTGYSYNVRKSELYYTDSLDIPKNAVIKPGDKVKVKSNGISKIGTVIGINSEYSLVELPDLVISLSTLELLRQNSEATNPEDK